MLSFNNIFSHIKFVIYHAQKSKEAAQLKNAKEAQQKKAKEEESNKDNDHTENNENECSGGKDDNSMEANKNASQGGTPVSKTAVKSDDAIEVSIVHFHIDPGHYSKSSRSRLTFQLMQY